MKEKLLLFILLFLPLIHYSQELGEERQDKFIGLIDVEEEATIPIKCISVGLLKGDTICKVRNSNKWGLSGDNDKVANIRQYDLEVCYKRDPNRSEIEGVIELKYTIDSVRVSAFMDCDLGIINECDDNIGIYCKNSVIIAENKLDLGDTINGIYIGYCFPSKLFCIKQHDHRCFIIELENVSYTTVGGGYSYILILLDKNLSIVKYYIHPWIKEALSNDKLLGLIKRMKA